MWGICKPKIEDAKGDIVIFKEKGIVKGKDVDSLDLLVEQYEAQGGKVTDTQHDIISEKVPNLFMPIMRIRKQISLFTISDKN